jgi:hypothetical protein
MTSRRSEKINSEWDNPRHLGEFEIGPEHRLAVLEVDRSTEHEVIEGA